METCPLDSSGSLYEPTASYCEHCNGNLEY